MSYVPFDFEIGILNTGTLNILNLCCELLFNEWSLKQVISSLTAPLVQFH